MPAVAEAMEALVAAIAADSPATAVFLAVTEDRTLAWDLDGSMARVVCESGPTAMDTGAAIRIGDTVIPGGTTWELIHIGGGIRIPPRAIPTSGPKPAR